MPSRNNIVANATRNTNGGTEVRIFGNAEVFEERETKSDLKRAGTAGKHYRKSLAKLKRRSEDAAFHRRHQTHVSPQEKNITKRDQRPVWGLGFRVGKYFANIETKDFNPPSRSAARNKVDFDLLRRITDKGTRAI